MTVAELIEQLKALPQDAIAATYDDGRLRRVRWASLDKAHEYKAYDGWHITSANEFGKPRKLRKAYPPFSPEYNGCSEDDREVAVVIFG